MICKLYVNCGEAPDQATCLASMGESAGYSATLNADVASGKVLWDGTMARTCVEALVRYYGAGCTQSALATASPPRPSTPRRALPPTAPASGAKNRRGRFAIAVEGARTGGTNDGAGLRTTADTLDSKPTIRSR